MRWSQQLLTCMCVPFHNFLSLSTQANGFHSGYSIISSNTHSFVVTNLKDGIDMFSMPPGQPLHSFKHNISCNVLLTITSALNRSVIIVGSDDRYARVYDPKMGIMTSILQHNNSMFSPFCIGKVILGQTSLLAGSLVQIVDVSLHFENIVLLLIVTKALSIGKSCTLATGSSDANDIKIKIWAMRVVSFALQLGPPCSY